MCEEWAALPERFSTIEMDGFVVMPNHLHGIIVIKPVGALLAAPRVRSVPTVGDIVRAFKSISAITGNQMLGTPGQAFWQRNYYEHIIRDDQELAYIREYVALNPSQWDTDEENPEAQKEEGPESSL